MKRLSILPLLCVSACACAGCGGHATLSFPNVQSPVLLGPVTRVGGGHDEGATIDLPMNVEVQRVSYSSKYNSYSRFDSERKASFVALQATSARKDTDVHIHQLKAGTWLYFAVTASAFDEWVEARGETRRSAP